MFTKDKANYNPNVTLEATHQWHEGVVFEFQIPKELTTAAAQAQSDFLEQKEGTAEDDARKLLVNALAEMVNDVPKGFEDFPADERPLAERMREYFDDPTQPELEAILVSVWSRYRQSRIVSTHLRYPDGTRGKVLPSQFV